MGGETGSSATPPGSSESWMARVENPSGAGGAASGPRSPVSMLRDYPRASVALVMGVPGKLPRPPRSRDEHDDRRRRGGSGASGSRTATRIERVGADRAAAIHHAGAPEGSAQTGSRARRDRGAGARAGRGPHSRGGGLDLRDRPPHVRMGSMGGGAAQDTPDDVRP